MGAGRVPGSIGYDGGLQDIDTIPFPPNAGFEARGHLGQKDASVTGPLLAGWPRQISWDEFKEVAT